MINKMLIDVIKEAGYDNKAFINRLGMAESTFYRKLKTNGFTINEACKAVEILKISPEKASEIFFTKQLA